MFSFNMMYICSFVIKVYASGSNVHVLLLFIGLQWHRCMYLYFTKLIMFCLSLYQTSLWLVLDLLGDGVKKITEMFILPMYAC